MDPKASPRRPERRGPLWGLLLAAVAGAGLLAYFGSRSARFASDASKSGTSSNASAQAKDAERPDAPNVAVPVPGRPAASAVPFAVPKTREEKDAYRSPPSEVDERVRDEGIKALVDNEPCVPPSKLSEKGLKGPGGVGCRIDEEGKVPVFVKHWVFRNPAGMLETGDFKNGKREGTWKQYHANGYLASEGEFVAERRDGVWKEWDEFGRFFAYRTYKNGVLDGVTVLFRGPEPEVEVWVNGRPQGREAEMLEQGPRP